MSKFDTLTKYIPLIKTDNIGKWIVDKENNGTQEHPIQMPFVDYSPLVYEFLKDFYAFEENNKALDLTNYVDILKNNRLEWNLESIENTDISSLNAQCALALIMHAIRSERYCNGELLNCFEKGYMFKCLERLNSIE